MTREELKEHCKKTVEQCEIWAIHRGEEPSGKVYEEHKAILDILEQEPCKDAISREAVLNTFDNWINNGDYSTKDLRKLYEQLSPVTPSRRKGHWIHFASSDDCSECGWSTGKYISPSRFCPNCGAEMVGSQESEK